ncbi:MAG: HAMP domain-containing protein, partial [Zymomonas sp.]
MSPFRTVSGKLVLITGIGIFAIFAAAIAAVSIQTTRSVEASVLESARNEASITAKEVSVRLNEAVATGNALTGAISGLLESGARNRAEVIALLKPIPQRYSNIFGSWMAERPGGFDGSTTKTGAGINEDGAFTPYWTKTDTGNLEFSSFKVNPTEQWFAEPMARGKGIITEPYLSTTKILLTSVSFPIMVNGSAIGVAGVDIKLDDLSQTIGALKPFGTGRALLVSSKGKWLVHPDASLLMNAYADEGAEAVTAALTDEGFRAIPLASGDERIVYPFRVPGTDSVWAAVIDVPGKVFSAPVKAAVTTTVIAGFGILILILGLLFVLSVRIVRQPLSALLVSVERMGRGDYQTTVDGDERTDEIGRLASVLEQFRHDLAEGRRLRGEQDTISRLAEEASRRQSAIDGAKAEDLRIFVHHVEAGFDALALGNLTVRMDDAVSPEFEPIRAKFNSSVSQLEAAIG